jgi:superfamily II DNA or RNA helicase
MLPLVREAAFRDDIKIEEFDKRTHNLSEDPNADLAWLRDYQREAVEACVSARRGIVRAPTGAGKTECFVGLIRKLPGKWLMLVHRDTLVSQAAERYKLRTGEEANILSRTTPDTWGIMPGLNGLTFQSLAAGLRRDAAAVDKALTFVDGVIIDEAHTVPADTYFACLQRCQAEYRIGFSGTPLDRTDNRSLMAIAALGKVIYSIKASVLIEAGILAAPQITMVPVTQKAVSTFDPTSRNAGAAGFQKLYKNHITQSTVRNEKIVELAGLAPKPCMVFVKEIEHGRELKKACEKAGFRTEFVFGGTMNASRMGAIKSLERGDADVLIASVVFQEGVDIPSLESVIIASGGKSIIAALQRIGRGMRTNNGTKSVFKVYDILDLGVPSLEKHSRRRMNTYVREGYETVIAERDGSLKSYKPTLLTRAEKRAR